MSDDIKKEEEQMEKLSKAVRNGWAVRNALTQTQVDLVRAGARKQFEEDKDLSVEARRAKAEKVMQQMADNEKSLKNREQSRGR